MSDGIKALLWIPSNFSAMCPTFMARSRKLDAVLAPFWKAAGGFHAWCLAHDLEPRSVYRARKGIGRVTDGTVALLSIASGLSRDVIRAACEASRPKPPKR